MRAGGLGRPLAPHERFTVAHEIGHRVLLEECDFRPERRATYWLGEALCQHFASELLITPAMLGRVGEARDGAALIGAVNELARRAEVSAEPAARALVGASERPVALGAFLLDPLPATRRLGFRGWWTESRSWWGGRGGRRLAVYVDHPLAPALEAMDRIGPGELASPGLAGAVSTALRRRRGPRASFAAVLG